MGALAWSLCGAAHCLLGHEANSVDVEGGAAGLMAVAATHALVLLRATTHDPGPAKGLWLVRALETVRPTPALYTAPYAPLWKRDVKRKEISITV